MVKARIPSFTDPASILLTQADLEFIIARYDLIVNSLGEKHLSWWEHKGSNQCRICDMIVIISRLVEFISSKSALDCMNSDSYQEQSEVRDA